MRVFRTPTYVPRISIAELINFSVSVILKRETWSFGKGHVGIVIYPAQNIFFSAMRSGLGIDSYEAPYWKRRGNARFYRYIKDGGLTNSQPTFELTHHE